MIPEEVTPLTALQIAPLPKQRKIPVLPLIQPIEFGFATSVSGLGRTIATDTTIAMAHTSDLRAQFPQVLKETLWHIGNYQAVRSHGDPIAKRHEQQMVSIAVLAERFFAPKVFTSGSVVGHTAAWNAKAIWHARFNAHVRYKPIDRKEIPLRAGALIGNQLSLRFSRSASPSPTVVFEPTMFSWHSPSGFDSTSLVYIERDQIVRIPALTPGANPLSIVRGFSSSYSVGTDSPLRDQQLSAGLTESIESRIVSPTGSAFLGGSAYVVDALTIRLGRFFSVPQISGTDSAYGEFVVITLHPQTFDIVYLGTARNLLHDFTTVDFTTTPFGLWLTQNT